MVSEERERVGNLPVNVFPILAEGGAGLGEVFNVLTSCSIGESNQSQSEKNTRPKCQADDPLDDTQPH